MKRNNARLVATAIERFVNATIANTLARRDDLDLRDSTDELNNARTELIEEFTTE